MVGQWRVVSLASITAGLLDPFKLVVDYKDVPPTRMVSYVRQLQTRPTSDEDRSFV